MSTSFDANRFNKWINRGSKAAEKGNNKAAKQHFLQALKEARKKNSEGRAIAIANVKLGAIEFKHGRQDLALPYLQAAYNSTGHESLDLRHRLILWSSLAQIHYTNKNYEASKVLCERVIDTEKPTNTSSYSPTILGLLACISSEFNQKQEALEYCEKAIRLMEGKSQFGLSPNR